VRQGITLIRVVQVADITPEPDEGERKAILAALAAEAEDEPRVSGWAAALLPRRDGEDESP
jgi:hypothetical protein